MGKHLDTFRELERLQMSALDSVKNQGLEGLAAMLERQQEIMAAIVREKGELRPFLDQWESLEKGERARLRAGRPGEILESLETVAKAIQARHQEMFGADETAGPASGGKPGAPMETEKQPDLSQMINLYRALQ